MSLTFQDVLARAEVDPRDVNVLLHSPMDRQFAALMPGLARTRRGIIEAYGATHSKPVERALHKGRRWVAIFLQTGRSTLQSRQRMLFLGLYENRGGKPKTHGEVRAIPEIQWLHQNTTEYADYLGTPDDLITNDWFDLVQSDRLAEYQGRLVIDVRLTPNYLRLAEKIDAPISAIHAESTFDAAPPDWRRMIVPAGILRELPPGWAHRLREWRGIYLIVDEQDGARYVGSAYGAENILGRWLEHVSGNIGVTVGLADRDPANFRFSILERLNPDASPDEVILREQTWMDRLHTARFGLNRPKPRSPEGKRT